jgi:hypothetical protein
MKDCTHKDCFYRIRNNGNGEEMCNYALVTKQARRCPAAQCDKYKPKDIKVNRFNHVQER